MIFSLVSFKFLFRLLVARSFAQVSGHLQVSTSIVVYSLEGQKPRVMPVEAIIKIEVTVHRRLLLVVMQCIVVGECIKSLRCVATTTSSKDAAGQVNRLLFVLSV